MPELIEGLKGKKVDIHLMDKSTMHGVYIVEMDDRWIKVWGEHDRAFYYVNRQNIVAIEESVEKPPEEREGGEVLDILGLGLATTPSSKGGQRPGGAGEKFI